MKIVKGEPPNFELLSTTFPEIMGRPIIFAYGDTVYLSNGAVLTPELRAHEAVHLHQQKDIGAEKWWDGFINDADFRLAQELIAHQVEYTVFRKRHKDRNQHARYLDFISQRLASAIYGGMLKPTDAKRMILGKSK